MRDHALAVGLAVVLEEEVVAAVPRDDERVGVEAVAGWFDHCVRRIAVPPVGDQPAFGEPARPAPHSDLARHDAGDLPRDQGHRRLHVLGGFPRNGAQGVEAEPAERLEAPHHRLGGLPVHEVAVAVRRQGLGPRSRAIDHARAELRMRQLEDRIDDGAALLDRKEWRVVVAHRPDAEARSALHGMGREAQHDVDLSARELAQGGSPQRIRDLRFGPRVLGEAIMSVVEPVVYADQAGAMWGGSACLEQAHLDGARGCDPLDNRHLPCGHAPRAEHHADAQGTGDTIAGLASARGQHRPVTLTTARKDLAMQEEASVSWSTLTAWRSECYQRFGSIHELPMVDVAAELERLVGAAHRVLDVGAGAEQPLRRMLGPSTDYRSLDTDPAGQFDY